MASSLILSFTVYFQKHFQEASKFNIIHFLLNLTLFGRSFFFDYNMMTVDVHSH